MAELVDITTGEVIGWRIPTADAHAIIDIIAREYGEAEAAKYWVLVDAD